MTLHTLCVLDTNATRTMHLMLWCFQVKKFDTLRRLLNTQPFPESVMIFVNDPIQVNIFDCFAFHI